MFCQALHCVKEGERERERESEKEGKAMPTSMLEIREYMLCRKVLTCGFVNKK